MDIWRYYAITHRDHVVCNPTSIQLLDELIALLRLPHAARLLDVGCGKGEFLIRAIERYGRQGGAGVSAIGIDPSPFALADLRQALGDRVPDATVELVEAPAAEYSPPAAAFDLAACLGATWAYGGYTGTLRALSRAARPGGLVLVGEPYWRREPAAAYLRAAGMRADEFGTHESNVTDGTGLGLIPLLAWPSAERDWDRYETLQWQAVARHAVEHPDDPDLAEIMERQERARHAYLAGGRDTLGWALYLFRTPADTTATAGGGS